MTGLPAGEGGLTYAEVGATAGPLPDGYAHLETVRTVGVGRDWWEEATRRLMTWEMHRRSGLGVRVDSPVAAGVTARLHVRVGLLALTAPVRVVAVVDEPDRRGFAYGTLPGHPECGEERFLVRLGPDGRVTAEIRAFSRPGRWYTHLAGPVARRLQHRATEAYLAALTQP